MVAANKFLIRSRRTSISAMEYGDSERIMGNAFGLHLPSGCNPLGSFCARRWRNRFHDWHADRDVDCPEPGGSVQKPEIAASLT